jgi:hypothetical protein
VLKAVYSFLETARLLVIFISMKKAFFVLIFILAFVCVKAQAFSVGNTCCNYNLVNKTFSTITTSTAYFFSSSDSYSFDIDGDVNNDILIYSDINSQPGSSGHFWKILRTTSATGVEFVYTNAISGCWYSHTIDNLSSGSGLTVGLNWKLTPSASSMYQPAPYMYYYYYQSGSGPFPVICGQQTNPFYIGFRKVLPSNDTIYGWVRMDSNFPGKVFDYAYTCGSYTGTPPASTITTTPSVLCPDDSIQLNAIPAGGLFTGPGVSGNKFKSGSFSPGTYAVWYNLPNSNGCSTKSSMVTFTVSSCVGIAELQNDSQKFNIIPNPNSGEFEIRGIKEEEIFISNELGELIDTKKIEVFNNYSVQINGLQNGVYFIGNKFSRQKVVVIR